MASTCTFKNEKESIAQLVGVLTPAVSQRIVCAGRRRWRECREETRTARAHRHRAPMGQSMEVGGGANRRVSRPSPEPISLDLWSSSASISADGRSTWRVVSFSEPSACLRSLANCRPLRSSRRNHVFGLLFGAAAPPSQQMGARPGGSCLFLGRLPLALGHRCLGRHCSHLLATHL